MIMSNLLRIAVCSAGLMLTVGLGVSRGQVTDGNLVGTVLDPTGARVSGASIDAENLSTGVRSTAKADAAGQYRLNNLPVGRYSLTFSAMGFSKAVVSPVVVELSKTATVPVTLKVGAITETVEVVATASLIDATTAQIFNIYPTRLATDSPVAANLSGGYLNLSLIGAGVASSGGVGAGTGPSVGGQRPRNNNFTIEGTDNNRKDITGPVAVIPNDAVAEFAQLALDPPVSPARVLPRHLYDQPGEHVVDRWSSGPVRIGPPSGHGRNAKLQLSVLLAPAEPVDGLYRDPQLRRRSRRVDPFSEDTV